MSKNTKEPISAEEALRPATQARLLLRWVVIAILAALVAAAYYFFFALAGSA